MVDRHTWTKYGKLLRRGELVLVRTKGTMVHTLAIQRSPPQFWLLSAEPVALSTFFAKPPTSMRYCIYLTLISKIVGVQGFD